MTKRKSPTDDTLTERQRRRAERAEQRRQDHLDQRAEQLYEYMSEFGDFEHYGWDEDRDYS